MTIHLIRSPELSREDFTAVYELLTAVSGTIQFRCDPNSIIDFNDDELQTPNPSPIRTASWESFFETCKLYRTNIRIPQNDMLLLLTEIGNNFNWFATLDSSEPNNGFIHTADWEIYLSCPRKFPIAYEVIALLLHRFTFVTDVPIAEQTHERAIGCVSDLCLEKKDIILKMRTADVCRACMAKLKQRMPMTDIIHAMEIMDSLRVKMMYAQNFKQHVEFSDILIDQRNSRIYLPGFGNIEIKLRPLEKIMYFLFLRYPEGLYLADLKNHEQELMKIFNEISFVDPEEKKNRIAKLVDTKSNSASEKISRIKRAFEEAIGPDLAKHYYIQGGNGERKKIDYKHVPRK